MSKLCCLCEVLEESVRELEARLVSEETEKLAAYERETQLVSKVIQWHIAICFSYLCPVFNTRVTVLGLP